MFSLVKAMWLTIIQRKQLQGLGQVGKITGSFLGIHVI
jgi:hypothetical protein